VIDDLTIGNLVIDGRRSQTVISTNHQATNS
jgi:hypothetical protein